jgi:hypothetical protein
MYLAGAVKVVIGTEESSKYFVSSGIASVPSSMVENHSMSLT